MGFVDERLVFSDIPCREVHEHQLIDFGELGQLRRLVGHHVPVLRGVFRFLAGVETIAVQPPGPFGELRQFGF